MAKKYIDYSVLGYIKGKAVTSVLCAHHI